MPLVKRIVHSHPNYIQNPDFTDAGNTSLHVAVKLGFYDIAKFLVDAGHEAEGISRNADWDTPLMAAVTCDGNDGIVRLLIEQFETGIPWQNKTGLNALMVASRHGLDNAVYMLLTMPGPGSPYAADPNVQDTKGDTALHYATSYGHLKIARTLLGHGAGPWIANHFSWTPVDYSSTVQAEMYLRDLVADIEQQKQRHLMHQQQQQQQLLYEQHDRKLQSSENDHHLNASSTSLVNPERVDSLLGRGSVRLVPASDTGSRMSVESVVEYHDSSNNNKERVASGPGWRTRGGGQGGS